MLVDHDGDRWGSPHHERATGVPLTRLADIVRLVMRRHRVSLREAVARVLNRLDAGGVAPGYLLKPGGYAERLWGRSSLDAREGADRFFDERLHVWRPALPAGRQLALAGRSPAVMSWYEALARGLVVDGEPTLGRVLSADGERVVLCELVDWWAIPACDELSGSDDATTWLSLLWGNAETPADLDRGDEALLAIELEEARRLFGESGSGDGKVKWPHKERSGFTDAEREEMFRMRHRDAMSDTAIAKVVGVTATTVKDQIGPVRGRRYNPELVPKSGWRAPKALLEELDLSSRRTVNAP